MRNEIKGIRIQESGPRKLYPETCIPNPFFLGGPCGLCERQKHFLSPAALEGAELTGKDKIL